MNTTFISPNKFTNAFLTKNNINERVIDASKQNEIANKIFNNQFGGGFSVVQSALRTISKSVDAKNIQQDFNDLSQGLNQNISGGFNYNYTKEKKIDIYGFVIGENLKNYLEKTSINQSFLGKLPNST